MSEETISFKVKKNKFWVLEQKVEEEVEKEEEYIVDAWVFNSEYDAIKKLRELITDEEIDFDKLEDIGKIGAKYNLQEVEIAKEKYNMRAISWLKVALLGFTKK